MERWRKVEKSSKSLKWLFNYVTCYKIARKSFQLFSRVFFFSISCCRRFSLLNKCRWGRGKGIRECKITLTGKKVLKRAYHFLSGMNIIEFYYYASLTPLHFSLPSTTSTRFYVRDLEENKTFRVPTWYSWKQEEKSWLNMKTWSTT